ncbi:ral guanine nucleotide dissociation stimulator-like [Ictidomys tridecemlineatus]
MRGRCLIHVYLEKERTTEYRSILVTCQDRAPVIIRRALDAHLLQQEDPENYELLQILSNHQKIKVPDHSLMYLSMNPQIKYYFIVRKRREVKGKEVNTYLIQAVLVLPFHSHLGK